jgi:hypothetical protein
MLSTARQTVTKRLKPRHSYAKRGSVSQSIQYEVGLVGQVDKTRPQFELRAHEVQYG